MKKKITCTSNFNSTSAFNFLTIRTKGILLLLTLVSVTAFSQQKIKLVILHTNDTHSQLEPTEKSTLKTSDMGGISRRMGLINKIRTEEKNVLLLDAGDFSQGTPYFNFYNGRIEVEAMNQLKYDAITIGNHEFDNGVDTLATILRAANFPVLSSNYGIEKTPLAKTIKPYLVLKRFGLRIGIITTNVEPKGLIIENNYKGIEYKDPIETANKLSTYLKKKKRCDIIICLSHLGLENDYEIAEKSYNIDVIIGGHSHSLIENVKRKNAHSKPVIIAQVGKSGLYLGRIELELEK